MMSDEHDVRVIIYKRGYLFVRWYLSVRCIYVTRPGGSPVNESFSSRPGSS